MNPIDFDGIRIDRVIDREPWIVTPLALFPTITPHLIEDSKKWLDQRFIDPTTHDLILSSHSYVIRTKNRTLLIDTCIGNNKNRPTFVDQHALHTLYLENLKKAGVNPEDVDLVLCTHLHPDHCGWNTRLLNGRWVPTFPKAKYLFSRVEFDYFQSVHARLTKTPDRQELANAFEDSVLPVVASRQALIIEPDHIENYELSEGIWLEEAAGHTPGHVMVHAKGIDGHALLSGDVLHHPLQLQALDLPVYGDFDSDAAIETRRRMVKSCADTNIVVLTGHFPSPTAGRIETQQDEFVFHWL
jgi:glyoxylase-like metal-dependent hydrolase (beta-lactamase superfamily II)